MDLFLRVLTNDWFLLGCLWIAFGVMATFIGIYKQRVLPCFFCGVLLGPLGMLIASWLPPKGKKCVSCGNLCDEYIIRCPECDYYFFQNENHLE